MKVTRSGGSLGRPRAFDVDKALERALRVFWEKGYEGTSLSDLTQAMGINRPSLYAAFGNKEALFRKALDRYREGIMAFLRDVISQPTVRGAAERLLSLAADMVTDPRNPPGCLTVGGADIRDWRTEFLGRAKGDSVKLKAARNSVSSFIRAGKALFSQQVLKNIELKGIERSPFADIEVKQLSLRYRSEIDFEKLLTAANAELALEVSTPSEPVAPQRPKRKSKVKLRRASRWRRDSSKRELFKIFLLAASAGLRRSEIDALEWSTFHFEENFIRITTTKFFEGKSEASHDDVYLDPEISALFRGFYSQRKSKYVIESPFPPKSGAKYEYYRCQRLFEELVEWLRQHGVRGHNPIHVLRKEYGSQLTKTHGIFVASRALRHSSVQTTEKFYASQKGRVSLGLGHLFARPENVVEIAPEAATG